MSENIPTRPRRSAKPAATVAGQVPKAPGHLSKESKVLFTEIANQWALGVDGVALLVNALESRDQYEVCRRQVVEQGATFTTSSGQIKAHPGAKLAIDYLSAFRMTMRQIGLQPEE